MPSFKWMFRLAILLSFAWIAFGQSPPSDRNGSGATGPSAAINAALSKVAGLRDQVTQHIAAVAHSRGLSIGGGTTNLGQNGGGNVQSMLTNLTQVDAQQIVSQLQSGVQRLIQETGSPNAEQRLDGSAE
jgi:hypothetical protein